MSRADHDELDEGFEVVEELRAARSGSTALGALLVMLAFVAGGICWALVECWLLS